MPWFGRALRDGVLTTRYPARPDGYGGTFRAAVAVAGDPAVVEAAVVETAVGEAAVGEAAVGEAAVGEAAVGEAAGLCPTGAIDVADGRVRVDRGRCILCGRCVAARPDLFFFSPDVEVAAFDRSMLVVPPGDDADPAAVAAARGRLASRVRALRRSVHIRHVDAGSDGSEEWEIAALGNPVYDVQRLGVFFTASPRHADLLMVTGAGSAGMDGPLRRTWEAMPSPKVVMAVGTDAISGGLVHPGYATSGGVSSIVPVDIWVPGSPPSPFSLLHAIVAGVGMLGEADRR